MTPQEVADRIVVCARMGCIEGIVSLVTAHAHDEEVAAEIQQAGDPLVFTMVYWAAPRRSLLEDVMHPHLVPHIEITSFAYRELNTCRDHHHPRVQSDEVWKHSRSTKKWW